MVCLLWHKYVGWEHLCNAVMSHSSNLVSMLLSAAYRMSGHHQENDAEEVLESAEPEAQEEPTDVASGHRFDDASISTWKITLQFLAIHGQHVVGVKRDFSI